jgi:hypothetical protein
MSPALGWSLIQSVAPSNSRAAMFFTMLWLFAWFAPLGFWSAAAALPVPAQHGWYVRTSLWASALLVAGWAMTRATGTSPLTLVQASWCIASAVVGAATWRRIGRYARQSLQKENYHDG